MKKEIREVTGGIVRVTTTDERWYCKATFDKETGLPNGFEFVPSVTWIAEHYPKGIGFYKWLANTGWDEAEALKEAAGDKGSKVHYANADLLAGKTVSIDAPYMNHSTGKPEPLTLEEYQCVMSFASWFKTTNPTTLASEITVWNDEHGYAGTIDYLCLIDGKLYLIDFKTSKSVYPSHEIQVSAYAHTAEVQEFIKQYGPITLAILQLGYERNRMGYKFTEVPDQFDLFLAAKQIWAKETAGQSPKQKDYPLSVCLQLAQSTDSAVAQVETEQIGGKVNGGIGRLGEEAKQDVDSGRRGNSRGRISGVQDRSKSV